MQWQHTSYNNHFCEYDDDGEVKKKLDGEEIAHPKNFGIAQVNIRVELAIDGAGSNGHHPRGNGGGGGRQSIVSGGHRHQYLLSKSMERSDRKHLHKIASLWRIRPRRDGDDVDTVGNGVVKSSEHVGVVA